MKQTSLPWIWVALAAVLLLVPGTGRFLLDVVGGLTLLLLLLPLFAGVGGFLAWQVIRRRLQTCPACGTISFGSEICPACGTPLGEASQSYGRAGNVGALDPSQVTINVEAVDVEPPSSGESHPSS